MEITIACSNFYCKVLEIVPPEMVFPHLLRLKAISCSSTTQGSIRTEGDLKVNTANVINILETKQCAITASGCTP